MFGTACFIMLTYPTVDQIYRWLSILVHAHKPNSYCNHERKITFGYLDTFSKTNNAKPGLLCEYWDAFTDIAIVHDYVVIHSISIKIT